MRKTGALAVVVLATALGAATGTPALAGPTPRVALSSQDGELALGQDGSATVSGPVERAPFDGQYPAVLTVMGPRGQQLVLTGSGTVTGEWVGPNAALTHRFTGRYNADSTVHRVDGTDGWYSVGLAATMSLGYVEAYDS